MSRLNLRKKTRISYYEPEEPNLDEYVFCTDCGDFVYEYCAIHKPLLVIPDDKVPSKSPYPPSVPRSALTIPHVFLHLAPSIIPGLTVHSAEGHCARFSLVRREARRLSNYSLLMDMRGPRLTRAGIGVFSTLTLPRGVRFGPYRGKKTDAVTSMYSWQIHDGNNRRSHFVDAEDARNSNWMRFVNCSRHWNEQNLVAYQYKGQLYYRTIKIIPKFTELMVFYGSEFANILQINLKKYNSPVGYAQKLGAPIPQKSIFEEKNRNKNLNIDQENAFKEPKVAQTVNPKTNAPNDITVDSNSVSSCRSNKTNDQIKIKNIKSKTNTTLKVNQGNVFEEPKVAKKVRPKNVQNKINLESKPNESIVGKYTKIITSKYTNTIKTNIFKPPAKKSVAVNITQTTNNVSKSLTNDFNINPQPQFSIKDVKLNDDIINKSQHNIFICDVCSYETTKKSYLITHLSLHNGFLGKIYACNLCKYISYNKTKLNFHTRTHTGEKPYECPSCHKKFSQKGNLELHIRTHTGEKPYECPSCHKKFSRKGNLELHIRTHTDEKPYECQSCHKKFSRKGTLELHIRTHTGEKPYECHSCHKKFNERGNLNVHIRTHTGEKPYECHSCHKKFSHKGTLELHIRTHTGEKPYECQSCHKKFSRKGNLELHIRTHTDEKPYECQSCHKKFSRKGTLELHIRTHTGEKPYERPFSQKKFKIK